MKTIIENKLNQNFTQKGPNSINGEVYQNFKEELTPTLQTLPKNRKEWHIPTHSMGSELFCYKGIQRYHGKEINTISYEHRRKNPP